MEDYIVYPLKVRLKQLVYLAANVADSSRENTSSGTQSVNIVYMISKLALLLQRVNFFVLTLFQRRISSSKLGITILAHLFH